jgi:hypothetical protein
MKKKDWLFVALAPSPVLVLAVLGNTFVAGWNWHWNDFLFAWAVIAIATSIYRLLATRTYANLAYKAGAALAVLTGFLIFWGTAAVQIIGEENPANVLYLGVLLIGLIGVGLARLRPAGLAKAAFTTAAATLAVPTIAVIFWPADFSPGVAKVFLINGVFALMFITSALLFRRAARRAPTGA